MKYGRRAILGGSLAVLVSCGIGGIPDPGRTYPWVPGLEGDLMMYAETREEVRAWIRDGVSSERSRSESWQEEHEQSLLTMPAFGNRFSDAQIEDLTTFVLAVSGNPEPSDSSARRGRALARSLGCFGCHGPGGRFGRTNPGSLKGYIPSWDGEDFPEPVRDRKEFVEWVQSGAPERLRRHRLARFFLDRAALHMPAYERFLEPGDVNALWAHVTWLRESEKPEAGDSP